MFTRSREAGRMTVVRPLGLEEAVELKARHPDGCVIAGGTDLMVEWNQGRECPDFVIDVSRLEELRAIEQTDATVFLGAGVTFTRILGELTSFVPLVQAAQTVGSRQIRNRATVGGNLGTASPAGDALPVLAAYDAKIVIASSAGIRTVPIGEFLVGPKRTALRPDELILGVRWSSARHVGSFSKVGPRAAMAIAVANIAVVVDYDRRQVRTALGSVGPTVIRAVDAEALAVAALADAGGWDDPDAPLPPGVAEQFGALVAAAAQPIDDLRGTAAYRRHACRVLGTRTLRWLTAPAV